MGTGEREAREVVGEVVRDNPSLSLWGDWWIKLAILADAKEKIKPRDIP